MKIVTPTFEILAYTPHLETVLEIAGRVCYKSEAAITPTSSESFIKKLRHNQHESVLEHGSITVKFVTDRGVSHELVRHRLISVSQESTRYCDYSSKRLGKEITFIKPSKIVAGSYSEILWMRAMCEAEQLYFELIKLGNPAQVARAVLPNSLKTELVVTANPREWMHIFKLRCAESAHPDMVELMVPVRNEFARLWPAIFSA